MAARPAVRNASAGEVASYCSQHGSRGQGLAHGATVRRIAKWVLSVERTALADRVYDPAPDSAQAGALKRGPAPRAGAGHLCGLGQRLRRVQIAIRPVTGRFKTSQLVILLSLAVFLLA